MITITKHKSRIEFVCTQNGDCVGSGAFTLHTKLLLKQAIEMIRYSDYRRILFTHDSISIAICSQSGIVDYAIQIKSETLVVDGVDLVGSFPISESSRLLKVLGKR